MVEVAVPQALLSTLLLLFTVKLLTEILVTVAVIAIMDLIERMLSTVVPVTIHGRERAEEPLQSRGQCGGRRIWQRICCGGRRVEELETLALDLGYRDEARTT
jgi:hypothetical protein